MFSNIIVFVVSNIITFLVMLAMIPLMTLYGIVRGLVYGFGCYILSVKENIDLKDRKWPTDTEPAQRSYFFGPGLVQYKNTVRDGFYNCFEAFQKADDLREDILLHDDVFNGFFKVSIKISSMFFKVFAMTFGLIIGLISAIVLTVLHTAGLIAGTVVFFIMLAAVFTIDKLVLTVKRISSQCPNCYNKIKVPAFVCPKCFVRYHQKLFPNKFGIFRHTCDCGCKLGSTFFSGRYKLGAFCPSCFAELTSAFSRPFSIHLVGGTKSGKTVYLSSFYHELKSRLETTGKKTELTVPVGYENRFHDLDEWFMGVEKVPNTVDFNAQAYPLLLDHDKLDAKRQLIVYDIAGEAISGKNTSVNLVSLKTCDAVVLMVDPFCSKELQQQVIDSGAEMPDHCTSDFGVLVDDLVNFLIDLRVMKVGERCSLPLAVFITKADRSEVRKCVGPKEIDAIMKNSGEFTDKAQARDAQCRKFLSDIGMDRALLKLEGQFTNVHFFPVSSMGHDYNGHTFEPFGVMEPFDWLMKQSDSRLAQLFSSPTS